MVKGRRKKRTEKKNKEKRSRIPKEERLVKTVQSHGWDEGEWKGKEPLCLKVRESVLGLKPVCEMSFTVQGQGRPMFLTSTSGQCLVSPLKQVTPRARRAEQRIHHTSNTNKKTQNMNRISARLSGSELRFFVPQCCSMRALSR